MSRQSTVPAGLGHTGTHRPWSETLCILPVLLELDEHAKDSSHSSETQRRGCGHEWGQELEAEARVGFGIGRPEREGKGGEVKASP